MIYERLWAKILQVLCLMRTSTVGIDQPVLVARKVTKITEIPASVIKLAERKTSSVVKAPPTIPLSPHHDLPEVSDNESLSGFTTPPTIIVPGSAVQQ